MYMKDTVTTVDALNSLYMQPLSPAVSHGNESHITNNPSASLSIIVRNHSLQVCVGWVY